MIPLVVIESITLWGIISTWICYKRDWYRYLDRKDDSELSKVFAIIGAYGLMPIYLLLAIIREFCAREWNYHK